MTVAKELKELRELVESFIAQQTVPRRERINNRPRMPEQLDPTPVEVPLDLQRQPTTRELVQEYVRTAMSEYAQEQDLGTFEEEDDFEAEDEDLPAMSGFEVHEMAFIPEEVPGVAPETENGSEAVSEPPAASPETEPAPAEPPR